MLKHLTTSKTFAIVRSIPGASLQDCSTRLTPDGEDGYNQYVHESLFSAFRKFKGKEKFERLKTVVIFAGRKDINR